MHVAVFISDADVGEGGAQPAGVGALEGLKTLGELALARAALDRDIPLLGICGGMQAMAVAAGGTLIQDLPKPEATSPNRIDHEQPHDPAKPAHVVRVDDPARRWLGERVSANSTHHQAVDVPGAGLVACGWSPDGVIEVIAAPELRFALGVQWHPELTAAVDRAQQALFDALVRAARGES